jgi:hypothetical protein
MSEIMKVLLAVLSNMNLVLKAKGRHWRILSRGVTFWGYILIVF